MGGGSSLRCGSGLVYAVAGYRGRRPERRVFRGLDCPLLLPGWGAQASVPAPGAGAVARRQHRPAALPPLLDFRRRKNPSSLLPSFPFFFFFLYPHTVPLAPVTVAWAAATGAFAPLWRQSLPPRRQLLSLTAAPAPVDHRPPSISPHVTARERENALPAHPRRPRSIVVRPPLAASLLRVKHDNLA
jgi:hypothetical protein